MKPASYVEHIPYSSCLFLGWLFWGCVTVLVAASLGELVSVYPVASGTYCEYL